MKTRIIVEGDYNDAGELKQLLGNYHGSEFHFDNKEVAENKLKNLYDLLSERKYNFLSLLPTMLMYNEAKATIIEY